MTKQWLRYCNLPSFVKTVFYDKRNAIGGYMPNEITMKDECRPLFIASGMGEVLVNSDDKKAAVAALDVLWRLSQKLLQAELIFKKFS